MKERILIIDDSKVILDFLCTILEREGYDVYISSCAYDNAELVAQIQPGLIILDFQLGEGQNGGQQIQLFKQHPATASIPILLCTAALRGEDTYHYLVQEYHIPIILKPFRLRELFQTIRRSLQAESDTSDASLLLQESRLEF